MLDNISSISDFINKVEYCPFCLNPLNKELNRLANEWNEKELPTITLTNNCFDFDFWKKSYDYSVRSRIIINTLNSEASIEIIERSSTPALDIRIIQEEFNYSDFHIANICNNQQCNKQYSAVYQPLQIIKLSNNTYKVLPPYFLLENIMFDQYHIQNDYSSGFSFIYSENSNNGIKTELLNFQQNNIMSRIYNIITFS